MIEGSSSPLVSVIIPARNEEENIARCLKSVVNQDYGNYEVIVIDDESTDGTAYEIERFRKDFGRIKSLRNTALRSGWTGKNQALSIGVNEAKGDWFLFLDADTELYPGAISRALGFCASNGISMVSFSPEQVVQGFWEKAIQPVIFEFLDSRYDYGRINNPDMEDAAANGQFILIERRVYEEVGGHEALKDRVLEDLELARRVKQRGFRIHFSYGGGIVRCRMYRSLGDMINGWTRSLFPLLDYNWMALLRVVLGLGLFSVFPVVLLFCSFFLMLIKSVFLHVLVFALAVGLVILLLFSKWKRFRRLNYPRASTFLYPLGAAFSMVLFLFSTYRTLRGGIRWKGREYRYNKRPVLGTGNYRDNA
jgi:chlorobactene glucosyltransferase